MDYTEKLKRHLINQQGILFNARLDLVELPDGKTSYREYVEHPGGVGIIPVDEEGYVYCVKQFRYCVGKHLLEIPAGKLERGEDPKECAIRELSEETGFVADNYVYLGESLPSPGYCQESLYIYLATGLHSGNMHLDEGEFLDNEKIHLNDLYDMVMKNEITDGKTIIAILKAKAILKI